MGLPKESQFHVLAVDDSMIDRKLIERLLKISSFQVTTVDSASKALEFLGVDEIEQSNLDQLPVSPKSHQEFQVNLIITDYCMPGLTGYDLLKRVKESSSLRNIPVVIMSSENVPARITRCLEEGAEEFFLKPVKLSDVNKLKPHMMKTRKQNQEQEEKNEEAEVDQSQQDLQMQQPTINNYVNCTVDQSQQDLQMQHPTNNNNCKVDQSQQDLQMQQPTNNNNVNCNCNSNDSNNDVNNNNIKNYMVTEEGIGEDRARDSRYNGLMS